MDRDYVALTADIAAAYFGNNTVPVGAIASAIAAIYAGLTSAGTPTAEPEPEFLPAVDPRKSIKADFLISLIDGKPYKMLRRHLANHGLTPEQYIQRYGLKPDYPMTAPNYTAKRRDLAIKNGLGRQPGPRRGRRKA